MCSISLKCFFGKTNRIESIERFKKDAKRLEELCTKFNIDYTTLSESERKEDSNNNKQKDDPLSECRSNDAEKSENQETLKNIKKVVHVAQFSNNITTH